MRIHSNNIAYLTKTSMKKVLILIGMAVILISPLTAQEKTSFPRHYLSLSVGEPWLNIIYSSWGGGHGYVPIDEWFRPEIYNKSKIELPALSLTYFYSINSWLMVGAEVYYWGAYTRVHERVTDEYMTTVGVTCLSIAPAVRFQYINRKYWGLYSGLSAGIFFNIDGASELYFGSNEYNYTKPAFQLTALGVRFGDRIYGTAELGLGNKGIFSMGIGTRF